MSVSDKDVRQAIYERLNGDTNVTGKLANTNQGGINHAVAPSNRDYPLVIFHKQSGTPTNLVGFGERWRDSTEENQLWLVKAIAKGNAGSAEAAAHAIANRLDGGGVSGGTLPGSGGTLLHMARESDVSYAEVQSGETYFHHGALYRVIVTP